MGRYLLIVVGPVGCGKGRCSLLLDLNGSERGRYSSLLDLDGSERGRYSSLLGLDGSERGRYTHHCKTEMLWKGIGGHWCWDWMGVKKDYYCGTRGPWKGVGLLTWDWMGVIKGWYTHCCGTRGLWKEVGLLIAWCSDWTGVITGWHTYHCGTCCFLYHISMIVIINSYTHVCVCACLPTCMRLEWSLRTRFCTVYVLDPNT